MKIFISRLEHLTKGTSSDNAHPKSYQSPRNLDGAITGSSARLLLMLNSGNAPRNWSPEQMRVSTTAQQRLSTRRGWRISLSCSASVSEDIRADWTKNVKDWFVEQFYIFHLFASTYYELKIPCHHCNVKKQRQYTWVYIIQGCSRYKETFGSLIKV